MSASTQTQDGPGDLPLVPARLGHSPALDGVRGLAILLVFLVHFRLRIDASILDTLVDKVFRAGWVGVDLFFVLSGFLITGILLDTRSDRRHFRNFYVRRVLRLFPVYYTTLAVLFILLPLTLRSAPAELLALVPFQGWYWTYTVNVFQVLTHGQMSYFNTLHLWSLSVEEQFYIFWPLVVHMASPRGLVRICLAAIALAFGFRLVATGWNSWAAYVLTPARMDALAMGGCLAVLARDGRASALIRRSWGWLGALSLGGVMVIVALLRGYHEDDTLVLTVGYLLNAVVFGSLLAGILDRPNQALFRPFHWRWLQWVGRVSYGAYVYHLLLLLLTAPVKRAFMALPPLLGTQIPAQFAWLGLMSGITLTIAAVSYRWLELPFLKLKDRFAPAS